MKPETLTLSTRDRYLRDNIKALVWFWAGLYKNDREKYEECTDGLQEVHGMLLSCREDFKRDKSATIYCYNKVVTQLNLADSYEKPGFEEAKNLFKERLK